MTTKSEIELLLEALHNEVSYFFPRNQGVITSGISSELKGWPELLHKIATGSPADITLEQLRALNRFNDIIVDPKKMSLGIPGATKNEYIKAQIQEKTAAALNKHPANKVFALLQKFYKEHIVPIQNALDAIKALDLGGDGFHVSNASIKAAREFITAVENLDPNFKPGMDPADYSPDLKKYIDQMDMQGSLLRKQSLENVATLLNRLENVLGGYAPSAAGITRTSFGTHGSTLYKAQSEWNKIEKELPNLRAGFSRN